MWVDYRDLWTHNHTNSGLPLVRKFERYVEERVIINSDVITTVSKYLARKIKIITKNNAHCVYNCVGDYYSSIVHDNIDLPKIKVSYVGTIWSRWRDPSQLFQLLNGLFDQSVIRESDISICIASRNPGDFISLSEKFGLRNIIIIYMNDEPKYVTE